MFAAIVRFSPAANNDQTLQQIAQRRPPLEAFLRACFAAGAEAVTAFAGAPMATAGLHDREGHDADE